MSKKHIYLTIAIVVVALSIVTAIWINAVTQTPTTASTTTSNDSGTDTPTVSNGTCNPACSTDMTTPQPITPTPISDYPQEIQGIIQNVVDVSNSKVTFNASTGAAIVVYYAGEQINYDSGVLLSKMYTFDIQ